MPQIPRLIIAGTNSGCGKTTVSTGIMAALMKRGLKVQPFKVGPDYIDPMFHTFITQRSSRNLDSWMLTPQTVSHLFMTGSEGADIAIIEGVMGFYDGFGVYSSEGSTAHVSGIINAPVILVVDAKGAALSVAAVIRGFKDFDPGADIKGVILNNVNSEAHFSILKEAIEERTGIAAVGYLKSSSRYKLPERHLGLVPGGEIEGLGQKLDILAEELAGTVDLELLLRLARDSKAVFHCHSPFAPEIVYPGIKIGVAMDKAFNFYYRDNLDMLEMLGAELEFFSPACDGELPRDIDGLYIGGGYPEVWGEELSANAHMRTSIKNAVTGGIPTYAECGGLMYMCRSITDKSGREFEMAGLLPGQCEMASSLQRFGYVEIEMEHDSVVSRKGEVVRGHEFHYSFARVDPCVGTCFKVRKKRRGTEERVWRCGYKLYSMLAGYPHIHFWSNPSIAQAFAASCSRYRALRNRGV
ncbi:cobyrinic acid a,c-diamide synthase [Anaerobacterium chartisolvens]|uniref:Cobyrinate a,c-diamide synthase n=1 Tax=Anaerobacterium chartisolvens TaxID=1297424 RepID=A0A369B8C7_9FIRM|nr:cobyrinate a,c-diamide synthase [Anaerobacterium chartisolvens]RCX17565.1 cobyrinic acid a,c-diamide synthase [Anaerobacterium chartisolvens]